MPDLQISKLNCNIERPNKVSDQTLFEPFSKIPRLSRECVITEKIDGTNAQIFIVDALTQETDLVPFVSGPYNGLQFWIAAGSRNRWITPDSDNYGFAAWVKRNAAELCKLGPGRHFGEWWGAGIQRRYNQTEKIFSLFNVDRWYKNLHPVAEYQVAKEQCPSCCDVVPVLHRGLFNTLVITQVMQWLQVKGSAAAPGFMDPEGIVIWHSASRTLFKKTIKNDESPKGKVNE